MTLKLSPRCFSAAVQVALVVALLLPMQAALAGGCCFQKITIKNLDTSRVVAITGTALTTPYDLSNFRSFTDFSRAVAKPSRSGPAYEVVRYPDETGWDHLIYYPSVGDQPGAVYYEGLISGSSEYDYQWFAVPPEQDSALRQALASQGFSAGNPPWLLPLSIAGLAAIGLILLIGIWRSRAQRSPALATVAALRAESDR